MPFPLVCPAEAEGRFALPMPIRKKNLNKLTEDIDIVYRDTNQSSDAEFDIARISQVPARVA